jgi:hypothetical protein
MLLPAVCAAASLKRDAGPCAIYAQEIETPGLAWDYWWSGRCVGGLASGPGFLFESMKGGGFGDVYAVDMAGGRMRGKVLAYGPTFLATEWRIQSGEVAADDDAPQAWSPVDAQVPRHVLPVALQEAVNRFAREAGHPQLPELPVESGMPRCPAAVVLDAGGGAAPETLDVAGFIRSHANYDAARKAALESALRLAAQDDGSGRHRRAFRAQLRLASAVAGCGQRAW